MIEVCIQKRNGIWFGVAVEGNKVVATLFSFEEPDLSQIQRRMPRDEAFRVVEKPTQVLADVFVALDDVFKGKDVESHMFKVDVSRCPSYTQRVLECTCLVPVGYVTSYGSLSDVVGGGARAVGQVMASNPVPLLIPCHRVVRSDLSIGGYGYGKQTKMELLRREDRGYEEAKGLKVGDRTLALFPVKLVKQNI